MMSPTTLLAFAAVCLAMVLTPGPNMAYIVSRSICQGRRAGLISLCGVVLGFNVYMLAAAFGLTALLLAVPFAYTSIRVAGAIYLAYLAWQALKPGGRSPFQVSNLPPDRPRRLFAMGLLTALLNPKVAALYLSLLPQFIDHTADNVLGQTLMLGATQIVMSATINGLIVLCAGTIAAYLAGRPVFVLVQRWLMGTVLAGLALRMATEGGR